MQEKAELSDSPEATVINPFIKKKGEGEALWGPALDKELSTDDWREKLPPMVGTYHKVVSLETHTHNRHVHIYMCTQQ